MRGAQEKRPIVTKHGIRVMLIKEFQKLPLIHISSKYSVISFSLQNVTVRLDGPRAVFEVVFKAIS